MSRRRSRILRILGIGLTLLAGLHYYVWARLVRDTALPGPWSALATVLVVALYLSIPVTFYLYVSRNRWARYLVWPGFIWMGMLVILPLWLLGADGIRLAIGLAGGLGGPRLREIDVTLKRLPAPLDGTTVVQLTDLHVGPTIGRGFLERLVQRSNALSPDVVAITGDLVDGRVGDLAHALAPLRDLQARWGVYFVTGNHEYYSGVNEWLAYLATLGVRVLRNERVAIGDAPHTFDLAGIDDHSSGGFPGHGPDLPRALEGRDPTRELVLLAHQPRAVKEAARHGVGLQLSGHTHGGQIWPFKWAVRLAQPHVAGLARLQDTLLYVSRGGGFWGPPMRLAAPAEITLITLRAVG